MPTLSIRKVSPNVEAIVLAADLAGIFVFAVEGALSAMRGGLDLLGVTCFVLRVLAVSYGWHLPKASLG